MRLPESVLKSATASTLHQKGVAGKVRMDPTPEGKSEKPEKSYLTAAVESISPWGGSRSSTPKQAVAPPKEASGLKNQQGGDHTSQSYGLSSKRYPPDCPPLNARWFYAVDVELDADPC